MRTANNRRSRTIAIKTGGQNVFSKVNAKSIPANAHLRYEHHRNRGDDSGEEPTETVVYGERDGVEGEEGSRGAKECDYLGAGKQSKSGTWKRENKIFLKFFCYIASFE